MHTDPTLSRECATAEAVSKPTAKADSAFSTTGQAKALSSPDNRFSYTTLDGRVATVTTCTQVNSYIFDAEQFAQVHYPMTWQDGRPWPPQSVEDLCCAPDAEDWPCVGDRLLTPSVCRDSPCKHSMDDWILATEDWETYFELRETTDRGIGVFARKKVERLNLLGWYAGELLVNGWSNNDYALSLTIGKAPRTEGIFAHKSGTHFHVDTYKNKLIEEVTIEAERFGNWTRFINHSCAPNTTFVIRRVGAIRLMAIKATRAIVTGEELTIHYGDTYFGPRTCLCGAAGCLEKGKKKDKSKAQDVSDKTADVTGQGGGAESLASSMEKVRV